jgi:hypothetical protein
LEPFHPFHDFAWVAPFLPLLGQVYCNFRAR